MKIICCCQCGIKVGFSEESLKIKRGTVHFCKDCYGKKNDIPEFLKGMMGKRRKL